MSTSKKQPNFLLYFLLPFILIFLLMSYLTHSFCHKGHGHHGEHGHHKKHGEHHGDHDDMHHDNDHEHAADDKDASLPMAGAAPVAALAAAVAAPFAVNFGDGANTLAFTESKNFGFPVNEFTHTEPVDESLTGNLDLLKAHLAENPNKRLTVTGKYLSSENYNGAFPDLGIARANDIKEHLVSQGFNAEQIDLASELDDSAKPDENGILFSVSDFAVKTLSDAEVADEQKNLVDMKASINVEPLVLNFQTNQAQISLTEEQRAKVLNIVTYVGKTEGAKVQVEGHTDSSGNADTNMKLGKDRAQFAADYLAKNGLSLNAMVVTSKGETDPIADNETEEGKAKNRRTQITVQ